MSHQTAAPITGQIVPKSAAVSISVSIVIPVRNGADYLRRTLPVLRRELPAGWEIIVVDDHSTDDSAAVARQFADTVIRNPDNYNDMLARNAAIPLARGASLLFLDADIRVLPGSLERLIAGLNSPGVTMSVGVYSDGADLKTFCGRYKSIWVRYTYLQSSREVRWMNTAFAAIRKNDFITVGHYDAYKGCRLGGSDIDFGRRISDAGGRVILVKDAVCDHLKEMSLGDLLRNDFNRTRGFFSMAVNSGEIRRVARGRWYGNISPGFMLGVVSALLVPAGLLLALVRPGIGLPLAAGALLAQQLCGLGFLTYAARRLGVRAALLPGLYFIDQLACALGLAVETLNMLRPRRSEPASASHESRTVSGTQAS